MNMSTLRNNLLPLSQGCLQPREMLVERFQIACNSRKIQFQSFRTFQRHSATPLTTRAP